MKFIASSKGSRKHPGGQLVEKKGEKAQSRKNTSKSLQFQRKKSETPW